MHIGFISTILATVNTDRYNMNPTMSIVVLLFSIVASGVIAENAEKACENNGFNKNECLAVGCCEWDDGDCWSRAGTSDCDLVKGDPCLGFTEKKCGKKEECTFFSRLNACIVTTGKGSIVRDGSENVAPSPLCTVGGGQQNLAGSRNPINTHMVIGGGLLNFCVDKKSTISGGHRNDVSGGTQYNTISGGWNNGITFGSTGSTSAVITGGGGDFFEGDGNQIIGSDTSTVSGGKHNRVEGADINVGNSRTSSGNTVTGGLGNRIVPAVGNFIDSNDCVLTGGSSNIVGGQGSVVVGGDRNHARGKNSIALGENAFTKYDHSMVVNLMGDDDKGDGLKGTKDGEFLVTAESFLFQIGNGNGNGGIDSTTLTKTNIQNLRTALEEE